MCGLVGIVHLNGRAPALDGACEALKHRGPDDAGTWVNATGQVAFGHRRLAILDLSQEGHQPFEKAGLTLIYNGEVYNFSELRRELEALGHAFRSDCDTEVVLEAYRAFGMGFVARLRGMFALALWDERAQRLLLARDRLGIKPLYVYRDRERIAFASELKALEQIPGLRLEADETAAYDFLTYIYVPAPKTIYRNVQKLLPAHWATATFSADRWLFAEERYWSVDYASARGPRGAQAVEAVQAALSDATRVHLAADVPLGCLLSGGIDSSAIAALAAEQTTERLRTFTIGFDVEEHSETGYARLAARHIGTQHMERIVDVRLARASFARLPALFDEPFGDLSAIPTLEVCRMARESVTVALSGDGGDEVFGGYSSYTRHLRRARWFHWVPALARRQTSSIFLQTLLLKVRGGPKLLDGLRDPLERHAVIQGGLSRAEKAAVLPAEVRRRFKHYDDLWALRAHDRADLDPLTRFQIIDMATYLPDDILVKVDRTSMACSLELRPPLLDHPLVELVASIPPETRNPGGALKALLKRAVAPKLPPEIIDRPKKGFSIPLEAWIGKLTPEHKPTTRPMADTLTATLRGWALAHDGPVW